MTIISFTRFNLMIETGKLEERAGGYVPSELPLGVQYGIRKNEIEQIAGKRLIDGRKIAETGTCVGTVTGPIIIFPCMIKRNIGIFRNIGRTYNCVYIIVTVIVTQRVKISEI